MLYPFVYPESTYSPHIRNVLSLLTLDELSGWEIYNIVPYVCNILCHFHYDRLFSAVNCCSASPASLSGNHHFNKPTRIQAID